MRSHDQLGLPNIGDSGACGVCAWYGIGELMRAFGEGRGEPDMAGMLEGLEEG